MTIPVPSLSTSGWVTSPAEKADLLLSHFFLSDYAQTFLYEGKVSSLPYILEQYGNDINGVTQQLRTVLEVYLSRYYDTASVDVTNDNNASNPTSLITLRVFCTVTENNNTYSIGKLLQISNSKLEQIFDMNNNGTPA